MLGSGEDKSDFMQYVSNYDRDEFEQMRNEMAKHRDFDAAQPLRNSHKDGNFKSLQASVTSKNKMGFRNQLNKQVRTGEFTAEKLPATPNSGIFNHNKKRFQSNQMLNKDNPYRDINDDDRTDIGTSIDMIKEKGPNFTLGKSMQGSDYLGGHNRLSKVESGFLGGSSIDVLDVLNATPDTQIQSLERGRIIKITDSIGTPDMRGSILDLPKEEKKDQSDSMSLNAMEDLEKTN